MVLFVSLLAPGFVYLERRESRHVGVPYTVLRETSVVITASLATLTASLVAFGLLRIAFPGRAPDVGRYIRDGSDYAETHYLQAMVWGAAILVLACLLAWCVAIPPAFVVNPAGSLPRIGLRLAEWLERRRGGGPISQVSGWTMALNRHPETQQWLDVVLVDGTSVHGMRGSHSTQIEETADRDLILAAPLSLRPPGGTWLDLPFAGTIVVSAARISYFTVQYVAPDSAPTMGAGVPESERTEPWLALSG